MEPTLLQNFSRMQEVKILQAQIFHCHKPHEFLRIMAVLLSFIFKANQIAILLNIGESSVYRYLAAYQVYPDSFFQRQSGSGRREHIDQKDAVLQCAQNSPKAKGYYHTRWSCGLLRYHLSKTFSKPISLETIRQTLRNQAVLSWKRVKHGPPPTPDPLAAEKLQRIQEVKDNLQAHESILYADESDFNLLCPIRNEWSPKGVQKVVTTPGKNKKIYAFGAYDPQKGRFIYSVRQRKRAREFIEFLYQLLSQSVGKVYLIVDNWVVHFGRRARAFCERHKDKIEFLPLPTYSPQHNKIERLWGIAKDLSCCNYTCQSVEELVRAAKRGLRMVQQNFKQKKRALADTFLSF